MTTGTVTQKLRPLRFGFLVEPSDRAALQQAIELATAQWGGHLSPIIPAYKNRLPPKWHGRIRGKERAQDVTSGYLSAFDPDYVVPLGVWAQGQEKLEGFRCVSASDLLARDEDGLPPKFGCDTTIVLHHLIHNDFVYLRRSPIRVLMPQYQRGFETFLSSVFGQYPANVRQTVHDIARDRIDVEEPPCTVSNYASFFDDNCRFPRRISSEGLDPWIREPTIFVLDAKDPLDIIDYWNLRAAGFYVHPVPKQGFAAHVVRQSTLTFARQAFSLNKRKDWPGLMVQIGRSMSETEVVAFMDGLEWGPDSGKKGSEYLIRRQYPRLWNRWAQENTLERPMVRYAQQKSAPLERESDTVNVPSLKPPFAENLVGYWRDVLVANEVSVRVYVAKDLLAEVLPKADQQQTFRMIQTLHYRESRISKSGLVALISGSEETITVPIARAHDVMVSWFSSQGWRVELSSSGRIASQIVRQVDGLSGLYMIGREPLLALLDKHASERVDQERGGKSLAPRWIVESAFMAEINRMINQEGSGADRDIVVQHLLDWKVVQLGLQLQCKTCMRHMWKRVAALDESIECEYCGSTVSIATAPSDERKFSYRPFGPFSVRDSAGGAYAVLMTLLRLVGKVGGRKTTPILSFNASPTDGLPMEVDLAAFVAEDDWRGGRQQLVFCECKAYEKVDSGDIERMRRLGKAFPGALLVFSKMAKSFSGTEVALLRRFAEEQRRLEATGRPSCRVMLLTGTELFNHHGIPECWNGLPNPFSDAAKRWSQPQSILDEAEATELAYLGLRARIDLFHDGMRARSRRGASVREE